MPGRSGAEDMPAYKDDKNVKRRSPVDPPLFTPSPNSSPAQASTRAQPTTTQASVTKIPQAPKSLPTSMNLSSTMPTTSTGSHGSATMSMPSAMPNPPPQLITSLGKKAPPKPKPSVTKKDDDDIFASMGLSAKPTFSSAGNTSTPQRPAVPSAPTSSGSGRWGQATASTSALGGSTGVSSTLQSAGSMEGGDDNWDDDGDLDDLLDD